MKYFLLIGFLTISVLNLAAQGELEPGYVVNTEGDTIPGFIMFEVDSKLSERVRFYKDREREHAQIFVPADLKAFGFHSGRIFESIDFVGDSVAYFGKRISSGRITLLLVRFDQPGNTRFQLCRNDMEGRVNLMPPVKHEIKQKGKHYNYRDSKYLGSLSLITENSRPEKELAKVKYRTRSIQKFIDRYNEGYSEDFPASAYRDEQQFTFDITIGAPVYFRSGINDYRIAVYADKTNKENSNKFSYRMGVSFRYWKRKEGNFEDGSDNQKMLKVIPCGFRWQSEAKKVMPYAYLGVGVLYYQDINYNYENQVKVEEYKQGGIAPALNIGIGAKVKVGKNYLLAEYTPAIIDSYGFINIGFSF